ncbi:protein translocase subunit SecF, partial [Selenomonadales bacterium OttesenSCG-928-I06]|nr:protein translocase subunit SecF [Selenomonadales bacterium OttesenSCG-928-I06]
SIAYQGFNFGIDFTGGTILDLKFSRDVSVGEVRDVLKEYDLENSMIQLSGEEGVQTSSNAFIRTRILEEAERAALINSLNAKFGEVELLRIEKVSAVIGSELTKQAIIALLASWLLIILYITFRFEFKFAIAGVSSLIVVTTALLGIISMLQCEIDSSFVAALLTVIGYSINDTIVIFDRIRENLKTYRKSVETIADLVNRSIWQSMTRSIYTVVTVLFATVSLYVFGGETTKNFALVMTIGFALGAIASIFLASQLWVVLRNAGAKNRAELKTSEE